MSDQTETQEEEITKRYKKAHYEGWLNQQIVGGKATLEEAQDSFKKNDEIASKYLDKLASVRKTILAQAKEMANTEAK